MQLSIILSLALLPLVLAGPFTIVSLTSGVAVNSTMTTNWSSEGVDEKATGLVLNLMNGSSNAANTVATLASGIQSNATSVTYTLPGTLTNGNDYFLQLCEVGVGAFSNAICSYSARFPVTGGQVAPIDNNDSVTTGKEPVPVSNSASISNGMMLVSGLLLAGAGLAL